MDEQELQELDLDEIMKEFGDETEVIPKKTPEQILQEVEADVLREQEQEETEKPASVVTGDTIRMEPVSGDTIRLDAGAVNAAAGETMRIGKLPKMQGTVRNAQPILEEEEEEEAPAAEPFSEEWEPEYEQPIAEYIPQRAVLIHPRSRLRELKKKLVAGPEKLYYALSEKGLGKVQVAILFSVLVVLFSAGATAMYAAGLVHEDRLRLMVFGQFLAMLISALLGSYQLLDGALDLIQGRFSLNTLLCFTFAICCVDGVLCLQQLRVPCCAAFSLQVTMSLWSAYQQRNTRLGTLDTMRKATHLDSLSTEEAFFEEKDGLLRGEGQVEDYMDTLDQRPGYEKTLSVYALVALCVSVAVGIVAGVLHGVAVGIQVAAVTTLAAMPASVFVTLSRPMAVLERRMHALGVVLCGWEGIKKLCGKVQFPVTHQDLFPAGTVKINGVKFYGEHQPDEIVAYAAALVRVNGGTLEPIFTHLLESRNGMHYTPENFRIYENGGIGGEVNDYPVLVGTRPFLQEMGVEIPEEIQLPQAVCVAVDGEFCGLFAVTYERDRIAANALKVLCGYRGLEPVLISEDFILTEDFIREWLDVKTKRMVFPDWEQRQTLREKKPAEGTGAHMLVTGEGLAPFAYGVAGARTLKNACKVGVIIHMLGGILGIVMMLVLAILGRMEYLTPAAMFLYELVWMIPGLLVTEWTRSL